MVIDVPAFAVRPPEGLVVDGCVAAAREERRRVVRDLHDGAQQRLVHTVVLLQLAQQALECEADDVRALIDDALEQVKAATTELRDLAHGILPPVLTRGGLEPALQALADRAPVAVELDVAVGRLPPAVEATAYFVVAEALTNVAKHARADAARVSVAFDGRVVRVEIADDGIGGADPSGTGLGGLVERVAALDGDLGITSAPGAGTCIEVTIPLAVAALVG